jgi:hypothetical protein
MSIGLKRVALALACSGAITTAFASAPARADETVVICKEALAQPLAAAGCAGVAVILHEVFVAKHPFGPNGEIMRVLGSPITIVDGNIKGANRESGELAKVLRGTIGISVRDIERYGIFGGPNSIFRKPFG